MHVFIDAKGSNPITHETVWKMINQYLRLQCNFLINEEQESILKILINIFLKYIYIFIAKNIIMCTFVV